MEMLKRCLQFYNHSLTILESIPTYVMLYAQKNFNLHHVVSLACSMLSQRSCYFGLTPKIQCTILTLSYVGGTVLVLPLRFSSATPKVISRGC